MEIMTKIGQGKAIHAAEYDIETGSIHLYCDALKYKNYHAAITDFTPPRADLVTCKRCKKVYFFS
jgi:hypothetical protein